MSFARRLIPRFEPQTLAGVACCPPVRNASTDGKLPQGPLPVGNPDPGAYARLMPSGAYELSFILDNLTCPACVPDIEGALNRLTGLVSARVNLTLGRLRVTWTDPSFNPADVATTLSRLGYRAIPYDPIILDRLSDDRDKALLRAVAVAGFAAANVMLISVSVWSGAVTDMGPATRDFFHWISALIALPAIAYAGRPFFSSAWSAVRARRVNMDVPISLGVLLATLASVFESANSGEHAYFDAAVMLLFFLLIGRYLDQNMRARTREVGGNLLALKAVAATVIDPDGGRRAVAADQLKCGMTVAVNPGDRIPADGHVRRGKSEIDASLVNGESTPTPVFPGDRVFAGTLVLNGSLEVEVTATDHDTLLGQVVELMNAATSTKSRYVALADRAARLYAPSVHVLAATTFLGWLIFGGGGWHPALMNAVAVLIITCPCALGLAIPAVQTVATSSLLKLGVLLKSGEALERLSEIDTVIFDKTGTLTMGRPDIVNTPEIATADFELAARLAQGTRHPLAAALVRALPFPPRPLPVTENPGEGVEAIFDDVVIRLGSRTWCAVDDETSVATDCSELWLKVGQRQPVRFLFRDRIRPDAPEVVEALRTHHLDVELLSGDRRPVAATLARAVGIAAFTAEMKPGDKIARLSALAAQGHRVLMVGDGLNDAPALAAAHVSMSPAAAADITQTAADIVFRGDHLSPIVAAVEIARAARRRMFENLWIAVIYNVLAVPLAMAGLVTPLIAAAAMSGSSVIVVANALRMTRTGRAP